MTLPQMIADGLTAPVTPVSEAHADALRARGFHDLIVDEPTPPAPTPDIDEDDDVYDHDVYDTDVDPDPGDD